MFQICDESFMVPRLVFDICIDKILELCNILFFIVLIKLIYLDIQFFASVVKHADHVWWIVEAARHLLLDHTSNSPIYLRFLFFSRLACITDAYNRFLIGVGMAVVIDVRQILWVII